MDQKPESEIREKDPHRQFLLQRNLKEIERVLSKELTPEQLAEQQTDREIELEYRADHDGLTGLLNFQGFVEILSGDLQIIQQNNIPAYLAFFDIDKLKEFNDTRGKMAGNQLIKTYANVLNETAERLPHLTFRIGRFGGDECVVLVVGASRTDILGLAEDIRKGVPEAVKTAFQDPDLEKTVSIGITQVRPDDDAKTLLERGDAGLMQAKLQRNHIVMK